MLCAEVGAIGGALTGQSISEHLAALVSVKSVYGHTEGAAGKRFQLCIVLGYLRLFKHDFHVINECFSGSIGV